MTTYQTDIGAIFIGAVQDLAPLLPLLGTEVCQDRIARGLNLGLLYPAAAPMTIFGSLGIALLGFVALLGSIDLPYFHGPTRIKNAGFQASGIGTLLLHVNERKHHLFVVEARLRAILAKKRVQEVEINTFSPDIVWWNLRLIGATVLLSGLGIIPYVYLIRHSLPDKPFQESWLYPIIRITGSAMVAVDIQLLFQLRILEETYYRLRFLAADNYLKDTGKSLPEFWDPNRRSKSVFATLRRRLSALPSENIDRGVPDPTLTKEDALMFLDAIHTTGSFRFPGPFAPPPLALGNVPPSGPSLQSPTPRAGTLEINAAEQGNPSGQATPLEESTRDGHVDTLPRMQESTAKTASIVLFCAQHLTTLGLLLTQIFLLVGGILIIVGYIGSFGIVQANRERGMWAGPTVWVVCEIVLFFARTAVWSWNPPWDDPKSPIVLEKTLKGRPDRGEGEETAFPERKLSYGIGWSLDSVTTDDMHALIIGIDDYTHSDVFGSLTGAKEDGVKMQRYLEEKLLVPPRQIRTLYNSSATKDKIVEEIQSLKHRISVAPQAPIIIFYAGHSAISGSSTYLVPYHNNVAKKNTEPRENDWLAYSELVNLLQQVGNERTDNIVLILDCCYAGAMARNVKWEAGQQLAQPEFRSKPGDGSSSGGQPSCSTASTKAQGMGNLKYLTIDTAAISATGSAPATAASGSTLVEDIPQVSSPLSPDEVEGPRNDLASHAGGMSAVMEETSEISIGYRSHILLAGAAENQVANESIEGDSGGQFTKALLDVLKEAEENDELRCLTYKGLVERITEQFKKLKITVKRGNNVTEEPLSNHQRVFCTTIYQEQSLFDGLFKRRLDEKAKPLVTVRYTDD